MFSGDAHVQTIVVFGLSSIQPLVANDFPTWWLSHPVERIPTIFGDKNSKHVDETAIITTTQTCELQFPKPKSSC